MNPAHPSNDVAGPVIATYSFDSGFIARTPAAIKCFVSSLLRSCFSGRIITFSDKEMPLFKIDRSQLEERHVRDIQTEKLDISPEAAERAFFSKLMETGEFHPRQWIVIANCATVALRNMDHLFPKEQAGEYGPADVDFLWTKEPGGASPGFWAVRGEHLGKVISRWNAFKLPDNSSSKTATNEHWSRFVDSLDLRKSPFERGEVYAPGIESFNWLAACDAAVITVPFWPEESSFQFIQSLYFGFYYGDKTGLVLNLLDT